MLETLLASPPIARKTVGEVFGTDDDRTMYEVHGQAGGDEIQPPRILQATTVLHPGEVDGRPFMTRGHFHTRPERGEMVLTLAGEGTLLLVSRAGETRLERMAPGVVSDIDGAWAHRVVNTGDAPLVFFVAWMSDCGHEYGDLPFPAVARVSRPSNLP